MPDRETGRDAGVDVDLRRQPGMIQSFMLLYEISSTWHAAAEQPGACCRIDGVGFPDVLQDDGGGPRRETHRSAIGDDTSRDRQLLSKGMVDDPQKMLGDLASSASG